MGSRDRRGMAAKKLSIRTSLQTLFANSGNIVSCMKKDILCSRSEILIKLEFRFRLLSRSVRGSFQNHTQLPQDIFIDQFGIVFKSFFFRHAVGRHIQHKRNPDSRSSNARLADADSRIDRYPLKECIHDPLLSLHDTDRRFLKYRHTLIRQKTLFFIPGYQSCFSKTAPPDRGQSNSA